MFYFAAKAETNAGKRSWATLWELQDVCPFSSHHISDLMVIAHQTVYPQDTEWIHWFEVLNYWKLANIRGGLFVRVGKCLAQIVGRKWGQSCFRIAVTLRFAIVTAGTSSALLRALAALPEWRNGIMFDVSSRRLYLHIRLFESFQQKVAWTKCSSVVTPWVCRPFFPSDRIWDTSQGRHAIQPGTQSTWILEFKNPQL